MTVYPLPAPDAPAEEWGRLAVSLPGWRWMMQMSDISGLIALEWVDEKRTKLRCWDIHDPSCHGEYRAYYLTPDPDDPATAGCLLALLGDRALLLDLPTAKTGPGLWRAFVSRRSPCFTERLPFGRACVAAAAALGRWPRWRHD